MEDHLIFYIDILGFREAVGAWDEEKIQRLTKLLKELASWRADSEFRITPLDAVQSDIHIIPAVTTFSDHIVMSYPTKNLRDIDPNDSLGTGLIFAKGRIGAFARKTAGMGLLIRGGITVGPLHHTREVVFGAAMNEAYELESRVSIYPRIAVARKVYADMGLGLRNSFLLTDDDGITHFNYFDEMLSAGITTAGRRALIAGVQQAVEENIAKFESEDLGKFAKWACQETLRRGSRPAAGISIEGPRSASLSPRPDGTGLQPRGVSPGIQWLTGRYTKTVVWFPSNPSASRSNARLMAAFWPAFPIYPESWPMETPPTPPCAK